MSNKKHVNRTLRILLRTEGGTQLGLGHLSRCRSLATAFLAHDAILHCAISDQALGEKFLHGLPVAVTGMADAVRQGPYDVAILDIPNATREQEWHLATIAKLLVRIDDEGEGPFHCDILIRPNLLGLARPTIEAESPRYWTGRDSIILHPDFADSQSWPRSSDEGGRRVLVCFGGSDPAQLTQKVLPTFLELTSQVQVEVILGSAFPGKDSLIAALAGAPSVTVSTDCPDMARRFAHSDLALISGGTMLYEAAALGVPAIVLCQNAAQQAEAEIFAKAGAVVNLGSYQQGHAQLVRQTLARLLADDELLAAMSKRGRQLVSRHGARAIVEKIVSMALSPGEHDVVPNSALAAMSQAPAPGNSLAEVIR